MRKLIETECANCGARQEFVIARAGYSSAEYVCPNCGRRRPRRVRMSPDADAEHDPALLAAKLEAHGVADADEVAREQLDRVRAVRERGRG